MNKYQLYKQIRQELAISCDRELKAVAEILDSGLLTISGGNATLDVGTPNALNSMSEAGRVFREELGEAVSVILERYRRSLHKEVAGLGLDEVRADGQAATEGYATRAPPLDLERLVNSAERLARPAESLSSSPSGKARVHEARS